MLITLSNHKKHASIKKIEVDLKTKKCTTENHSDVHLDEIKNEFHHPLLEPPDCAVNETNFVYTYDSVETFLNAPFFVYATLLFVEKPLKCQFQIKPSARFKNIPPPKYFKISLKAHEQASETITTKQLNSIVSELCGFDFYYQDDLLIDAIINTTHLPKKVNGDDIIACDDSLVHMLKNPPPFKSFEFRIIDPFIGFALFAEEKIAKGTLLGFYSGIKQINSSRYMFKSDADLFNLGTDSEKFGNFTRFINHAPEKPLTKNWHFLLANIESSYYLTNGVEIVIYKAKRDIEPGEQLLINYGRSYFKHINEIYFNEKGEYFDKEKRRIKAKKINLKEMKMLADIGVKKAQHFLMARYFSFFILIFLGIMALNTII